MTALAISIDGQRLTAADNTTSGGSWAGIGGGTGHAVESDFKYQGSACVARKGATSERGFYFNRSTGLDMTQAANNTWLVKCICTTPGLLRSKAAGGFAVGIGTGTSAYCHYVLHGSDTYPASTSWIIIAINPNILAHRSSTVGSPVLTAIRHFILRYNQSGTSKESNQGLDAIDIVKGMEVVGGTLPDASVTWEDLSIWDEGTEENRWGVCTKIGAGYQFISMLQIGKGGQATRFIDDQKSIYFPAGLADAEYSGIQIDASNTGTSVSFSNHTFTGDPASGAVDQRPIAVVLPGFSALASVEVDGCTFLNFAKLQLKSISTIENSTFKGCGVIDQEGGVLNNLIVEGTTANQAVSVNDLGNVNGLTIRDSAVYGLDLTAIADTEITLTGIVIAGSGTADVVVDNPSDVNIYLGDGSVAVTVVNIGAGNAAIIAAPASITLTGIEPGSRISVIRVSDRAILDETLNSGSAYTFSYTAEIGTDVWIRIQNFTRNFIEIDYTLPVGNVSFPINQNLDRIAKNP